jgi:hypothetical protein
MVCGRCGNHRDHLARLYHVKQPLERIEPKLALGTPHESCRTYNRSWSQKSAGLGSALGQTANCLTTEPWSGSPCSGVNELSPTTATSHCPLLPSQLRSPYEPHGGLGQNQVPSWRQVPGSAVNPESGSPFPDYRTLISAREQRLYLGAIVHVIPRILPARSGRRQQPCPASAKRRPSGNA